MNKNSEHCNSRDWRGKPYNFFGDYLLDTHHVRMLKLPINAGLSCPNRDGTIGAHGCIFCDAGGSASPTTEGITGIAAQMENARRSFRRSDVATRYIAYFQAFTNTYASIETLKRLYDTALASPDIIGLMIGTRPDCLPDDVLDLVASYNREGFELWLEIGMQTMHDESLRFLRRGHTHQSTRSAVLRASERGICVCAHIILGIPHEEWRDMMATAMELSSLPVHGVKLHHLHVVRNTQLEHMYQSGGVRLLGFREYVSTVCDFIERLRPDILIHRLLGDRPKDTLVAPKWAMHKGTVLKAIEDEFRRRGTCQGFLYTPPE